MRILVSSVGITPLLKGSEGGFVCCFAHLSGSRCPHQLRIHQHLVLDLPVSRTVNKKIFVVYKVLGFGILLL